MVAREVKPGLTTAALDRMIYDFVLAAGAIPATIYYRGLSPFELHLAQRGRLPRHSERQAPCATATS